MSLVKSANTPKRITRKSWCISKSDQQLLLLALPVIVYLLLFNYLPMYGMQIAFKDFKAAEGIFGSDWRGLDNFIRFFSSPKFTTILSNTLVLSISQLLFSFPMPIILALLLNQTQNARYKKFVQTVTYAPHFISIVVLVGMMNLFLSPNNGVVIKLLESLGVEAPFFLGEAGWFRPLYILSGIWQSTGWGSIIYLAALSSIDPSMYEAATIDGCSRWNLIRHIDIPMLMPTAILMLIMNVGRIMDLGFQKAYLMQNPLILKAAEIIPTYVYKVGMIDAQYSYSTAINLFNSVINIILLFSVNKLAKRVADTGLF